MKYSPEIEAIKKRQELSIIAVVRSGIITAYNANKNIPEQYKKYMCQLDEYLFNAQEAWNLSKDDHNIVVGLLRVFQVAIRGSGLAEVDDMTTTIALSQVACDELLDICDDDKRCYIEPIVDLLGKLGHMLHDGMQDKFVIEKTEIADEIVGILYKIIGYKQ